MSRFRHEYKYRIDAVQNRILKIRAEGILERDAHARPDGTYLIRSLYFDDLDDSCFFANEAGTDPRSKFRIRYYNNDPSYMQLEKKSKTRGMTAKESCFLTPEECGRIIRGEEIPLDGLPDEKKKLLLELRIRGLLPRVIVTYLRYPFTYPAGNVRVTFDEDITSSYELDRFLTGDYAERPILRLGESVMEVKWDEVLPLHIKETLFIDDLRWSSFSKYYSSRNYHM